MNSKKRDGFTLVEVLIVVVIMAILAATIIPQFNDSVSDANESQLSFNLHTLRSQIQLFKAQHGGVNPAIANNLEVLTKTTNRAGALDAAGEFGPYVLGALPKNPITDSNTVNTTETGTPFQGGGWLYNPATGEIWADGEVPAAP